MDKTLYAPGLGLFSQIELRMCSFISRHFDMEPEDAWALQKTCYLEYGTTLQGLIRRRELEKRGLEPDDFLKYVHNIDYEVLKPDALLARALEALPGRLYVFTNGTDGHARRILHALKIDHLFEGIFDIRLARYISKPDITAYHAMTDYFGIAPHQSVMFDDAYKNLLTAAGMGMRTVWVRTPGNPTPLDTRDPAVCHYATDNLAEWLKTVPFQSTS